jgi:hypothetical protein
MGQDQIDHDQIDRDQAEQHARRIADAVAINRNLARLQAAEHIVAEQAKDEALWCVCDRISEAHLQQELRRLHEAIEGKTGNQCAREALAQ